MKIFQVVPYYPPHVGGMEFYVQRLSEELVARGHEVTVFTSSNTSFQSIRKVNGVTIFSLKKMTKVYNVAVVGATGAVGEAMLSILEERRFPVGEVYALASSNSVGKRIPFKGGLLKVEDLATFDFSKAQIGLFSPGGIKGPRGLIRIGLFTPGTSEPQLLNFIAVEPVIQGPGQRGDRMAFSEMETSVLDPGLRGKRMWVHPENGDKENFSAGTLETLHVGDAALERLSVRIDVEKFTANGAHVYVVASIDSDHPSQ